MIEQNSYMFKKKRRSILILEDETALSKALCIKLQTEGFNTTSVGSGVDAIKQIDTKVFDLIILDLVTPHIDGFKVLKHLRSVDENVPAIVVSNLSQKEDMKEAIEMGANKYFIKSNISLTEILDETKKILE